MTAKFDRGKAVREIARERVGQVRGSRPIPSKKFKSEHRRVRRWED